MFSKDLRKYINEWNGTKNLILVTHYVVISEMLNIGVSSGEIIVTNKSYKAFKNCGGVAQLVRARDS